MTIRKHIEPNTPLTAEQIKMLEEAQKKPAVYDEECPPLTPEQLKKFRRVSDIKPDERKKRA